MPDRAHYSNLSSVDPDSQQSISKTSSSPKAEEIQQNVPTEQPPSHHSDSETKASGAISPIAKPLSLLILGGLIALAHHFFNSHANGKLVSSLYPVPQVWVSRAGTAFAYGFKTALATSLGFVLCQLMWLTLRRKFMNLAEIDLIYQVAEKDALATFASSAVVKSPLLVVVAALTFILPISTVLAPSSLRVVPHISTSWKSCQIPSGNLANDGSTLYLTGFRGFWSSSSPAGQQLAIATLVGQQILPIRSVCGSDCEYSVSFPSVAIQCQSGAEIPEGMKGEDQIGGQIDIVTYWNATPVHPLDGLSDPSDPFYVYWNSHDVSGSSGQARCTVGLAQYSFTIRYSAGQQSVSYNVTHTGDRIFPSLVNSTASEMRYSDQLLSVAFSARFVLLGALSDVVLGVNGLGLTSDSLVTSAAFLDSSSESFIWGDVVGGIEQLSHNISAGILTLNLGVQDGQCLVDTLDVVYQYDWLNLFLPYAIIFLLCSLCVAAGIIAFFRFNPENLTSSFSDTVSITRNPTLDTFVHEDEADETRQENSSLRLRLGKLRTGGLRFGTLEDLKSE